MRTTITLDPDTAALVRRRMRERGLSFKQVVNEGLRAGLAGHDPDRQPFRTRTADLGRPTVDLDGALRLATDIEDGEIVRKLQLGK